MNVSFKGDWNIGTTYDQGDFVVYENIMYIALSNILSGQLPPNNNASWDLVVYGGEFEPSATPTNTPTQTVTPTIARVAFTVHSATTKNDACNEVNPSITIYGNNSQFDLSTIFWNVPNGNSTVDMTGFYENNNYVAELNSLGNTVGFGSLCVTQTPTPTNTQTLTPTNTETPTPTNTETPTNTPTNTETPTNTPTNTETPTSTPTNTPTPTISNVILYVGNNDFSNGSQVSGITINSVPVDFVAGVDFPVPYNGVGNSVFSTTQFGGTYNIVVGATCTTPNLNSIRVQDSNGSTLPPQTLSATTGTYVFNNVFINIQQIAEVEGSGENFIFKIEIILYLYKINEYICVKKY